jgi:hypothetical protein
MPASDEVQEEFSESASASVSTAMHHMIDGLVDSEISDDSRPVLHLTPLPIGQSYPTPTLGVADVASGVQQGEPHQQHGTLTAQDLVNQMLRSHDLSKSLSAPNIEREQTIRTPISSFSSILCAPSSSWISSPQTRPTTAHKMQSDNPTPVLLSSGSAFQQEIVNRQQQLQIQSTPIDSQFPTSSWSYQDSPVNRHFPPLQSSPWTASVPAGTPSARFDGDEVPRKVPPPAMFGAIGQTPPSAQAS